jgi:hypothetical protein
MFLKEQMEFSKPLIKKMLNKVINSGKHSFLTATGIEVNENVLDSFI